MKLKRRRSAAMSEINVTPMVDVMLVLLIIFMVTAPLLQQGIDVDLPVAKGSDLPAEERLTIVIKKDGSILLNKTPVSLTKLHDKMKAISKQKPTVYLKADKDVPYGLVVQVMGEVKEAGIEKLGMITEPKLTVNK